MGLRGQHAPDEPLLGLALLFFIVLAIPFGFVVGAIYVPAVLLARGRLGRRPVALGAVGAVMTPIAALALLMAGAALFGRPWPRALRDLLPFLLPLVIGDAVFGLGVGWSDRRCQSTDGGSPDSFAAP